MACHEAAGTLQSHRRCQRGRRWYPVLSALIVCGCLRSADAAAASVAQFSAVSAQCGTAGVQVQPECRQHPTVKALWLYPTQLCCDV